MAQQKGHTEYFSTVLLIFTPRDAAPPKATELQAILQGITPVLETLQRYGCQDQSQYRPANSNSIQPLLETHTDLPDINKAVQRPAVLNNKDNNVKVSLHICATSSNQF